MSKFIKSYNSFRKTNESSYMAEDYPIYKKRDGQDWILDTTIYASSFDEARKKFAKLMTDKNWELSNNIQWISPLDTGSRYRVEEEGWYDISILGEEDVPKLVKSKKEIEEGFDTFSEDVYTWELRQPVTEPVVEAVKQVDDIYKVGSIGVPQSLINSYVKKVKDETGKNLRQMYSDAETAEELIKFIVDTHLNSDNLPVSALLGSGDNELTDDLETETPEEEIVTNDDITNDESEEVESTEEVEDTETTTETTTETEGEDEEDLESEDDMSGESEKFEEPEESTTEEDKETDKDEEVELPI